MSRCFTVVALASGLGGCELLPQDGTEWTIALGVGGGLVVLAVVAAWYGMRKNR